MKGKIGLVLALVLLSASAGWAQRLLPSSVQLFLQERASRRHFAALHTVVCQELYRYVPSRDIDGREMVDAFIGIDNDAAVRSLEQMGVMVNSLFDGFVTAQVPVDRLEDVSCINGVNDVEIGTRLTLCTDSTMSVTHVNQVLNGPQFNLPSSYDGTGVVVAVIDKGFDYQHRAFRRNDDPDKTRIVRVYSTTDKSGHNVYNQNNVKLPGSAFMDDEIYGLTTDSDGSTHGTHTSSIAAGSHVGGYGGMAPGADIFLCAVGAMDGSMSTVEVANCIRYITAYADSVGKPSVTSISVSTSLGPHDGKDYLSRVINQMMGPGHLIVVSAGNEGSRHSYAHKCATPTNQFNTLFKYKSSNSADSTYYYSLLADIWMREVSCNFYYKFHVLDQWQGRIVWETDLLSSKAVVTTDEISDYFIADTSADTIGYIQGTVSSSNNKYRLSVKIHNMLNKEFRTVNNVKCGRYALGMTMYPRRNIAVDIDAWSNNSGSGFAAYNGSITTSDGKQVKNFYTAPNDSCCICNYAVADSIISAGAFAGRNSYYSMSLKRIVTDNSVTVGDIASFSGYQIEGAGPTGKPHPVVCAPGITVVAAGSQYSYFARGNSTAVMKADGSYWGVMSGTSMAAPTVAGIIALWLQANPKLSVADVKDIIAQTAIKDQYTNGVNRNQFGPNGKIDAMAGLRLVLDRIKPTVMKGDVNSDGKIDVMDIALIINYVLGRDVTTAFNLQAADIDDSGDISVIDIARIINMILGR